MSEQEYAEWKASGLPLREYLENQVTVEPETDLYAGFNPFDMAWEI
jgi:hypothetical protein